MVGRTPLHFVEVVVERLEKGIPGVGDAASKKNNLGVDRIDERDDARCKVSNGTKPDGTGFEIASEVSIDQFLCAGEATARTFLHRAVADGVLQAPGCLADIRFAEGVEGNVAEVARPPDVSTQESPVADGRAAHACAYGEQDDVILAFSGALSNFPEEACLGIIHYPYSCGGVEEFFPVQTLDAGEPARHEGDAGLVF